MKYTIIIKILLSFFTSFSLQEGDLLFQDVDCGPFCDAIEKVTVGYQGADFSHIGIVDISESGELHVIEATSKGVIQTPIEEFLEKSLDKNGNPKVMVGRLNDSFKSLIPSAIAHSKTLLGKKYDDVFDINNDTYYCSELIYEAFKNANQGKPIFDLQPMTFIDPDTGKTFGIWTDYYKKLNQPIPEGKPGLNPGGISLSDKIDIVHSYYNL